MSTAGPNFPTTATGTTNAVGGGSKIWSNPTRVQVSDSSFATCLLTIGTFSDDLKATGFGFAIPAGATINGILLEINYKDNTGATTEANVRLLKAGTAAGSDKNLGATFGTTAATVSYGGSADLWGTTWATSDINDANFGATFVCNNSIGASTASVDYMRVTVTYTQNANVNAPALSATGSRGTATFSGTATVAPSGVIGPRLP